MSKQEAFKVLENYPKEGPPVPEREKVHREKNKHESGTGRRDREKREGRGKDNWGNDLDDQLHQLDEEPEENNQQQPPQYEDRPNYEEASKYFEKEDNDDKEKVAKQVVKVPPEYIGIVKTGENVEVVPQDPNDPNRKLPKPQPKLEKKPKREPYVPEKDDNNKQEEEEENERRGGKKPRDQQFKGVQHNRVSTTPQAAGH